MTASEAQRRANAKQDATRKRVALFLDTLTARKLDELRGDTPRATYIRALIEKERKRK